MSSQQTSSPSGAALFGQLIGNYRLVRLLGEGGMGMVYEAVHVTAGGQAAIKILRPEVAGRHDITARFFNEARAANSISHPSIVRVFDCGYSANGLAFLAMEFLSGETLRARLERGQRLTTGESLRIARQIASALHAAHQRQVIHRDIKPDNIMLVPDPDLLSGERVKVLDFGISKIADSLGAEPVHTRSDLLMGTPTYMAPEQCRGAKYVTDKSDVYSLGVILYQMLTGKPPFVGESVGELIAMHLADEPLPLSQVAPHVGPQVASLVHAMLEKKLPARPTMDEALRALLKFVNELASFPTIRPSQEISISTINTNEAEGSLSLSVNQQSSRSGNYRPGPSVLPETSNNREQHHPIGHAAVDLASLSINSPKSETPTQPLEIAKLASLLPSQALTERRPIIVPMQQAGNLSHSRHASSDGKSLAGTASELLRRIGTDQKFWNGLIGFIGLGLIAALITWQLHKHKTNTAHTTSSVIITSQDNERNPSTPTSSSEPSSDIKKSPEVKIPDKNITSLNNGKSDIPAPVTLSPPSTAPNNPNKEDVAADQTRSKALAALRDKNYPEALQLATNCVRLKPNNSKCWWILGKSACRSDEYTAINRAMEKLAYLGKNELVDEIVKDCLDAGLRRDNKGGFFHADLRNPFIPPGLKMASDLAARGSCDEAIRMAKTYIETQPRDAWYTIGKCACSTKKISTANLAIEKLNDNPSSKFGLINICTALGFEYSQGRLSIKQLP